jgi:hypothetical protein
MNCEHCQAPITQGKPSRFVKRFCSGPCRSAAYWAANPRQVAPRLVECVQCGSSFAGRSGSLYCSRACSARAHRVPPTPTKRCAGCGELKGYKNCLPEGEYRCQPCRQALWSKCERCGNPTGSPTARFCSRACISKWYTCEHCGNDFTRKAGPKDSLKYCSRPCSFAARSNPTRSTPKPVHVCACTRGPVATGRRICALCVDERSAVAARRAIEAEARRLATRQRALDAERKVREWRCEVCLSPDMWHKASPYCAPCRRVITKGKKEHRSRARHFGVHYEPVNAAEVFKRDNWTCHLCAEPISRTAKWPDQMCASLDHVVPMSKGGPHTFDNVAASHWLCNVLKSDDEAIHFRVA